MFFVGDVKNPVMIGKKGEIMDMVDSEFNAVFDEFRWVRCGMKTLDLNKDPYSLCVAVRSLIEAEGNGR